MKFKKEYLSSLNGKEQNLSGEFPYFFFFCDINENVLHYELSCGGSIREIPSNMDNYCRERCYSPHFLMKASHSPISKGACVLIAGYYNVFTSEWIECNKIKFEPNENGEMEPDDISSLANDFFPYIHNVCYYNKKLMDMNISSACESSLLNQYASNEKNLSKIDLYDLYKNILNSVPKNSDKLLYIDPLSTKEEIASLNINDMETLNVDYINHLLEKHCIEKTQIFNLINTLRVYNIADFIIYDKSGNVDSYTSPRHMDMQKVIDEPGDYFIAFTLNKRIVEAE